MRVQRRASAEASDDLLRQVRDLLDDAFEGDFSDEDWAHTLGGWHVVAFDDAAVVAHAAVVHRTIRVADVSYRCGYVEGVATRQVRQRQGSGSAVMAEASALIRERFELGVLSTGLHEFYGRLGWESWQGPSFVDDGGRLVRTEEEDDGIMVLRVGPSAGIDLVGAMVCESRQGDDW